MVATKGVSWLTMEISNYGRVNTSGPFTINVWSGGAQPAIFPARAERRADINRARNPAPGARRNSPEGGDADNLQAWR